MLKFHSLFAKGSYTRAVLSSVGRGSSRRLGQSGEKNKISGFQIKIISKKRALCLSLFKVREIHVVRHLGNERRCGQMQMLPIDAREKRMALNLRNSVIAETLNTKERRIMRKEQTKQRILPLSEERESGAQYPERQQRACRENAEFLRCLAPP